MIRENFDCIRRSVSAKETLGIGWVYSPGEDILLQREEPAIDNRPKGTALDRRGGETLHEAPVNGFQTMQRGFGLADLDFRGGEAEVLRPFLNPACEEGLPPAVLAPHSFELTATRAHGFEFVRNRTFKVAQTDSQRLETAARHRTGAKSVDDIGTALRTDESHRLNWRSKSGRSRTTMSAASSIVRTPYPS